MRSFFVGLTLYLRREFLELITYRLALILGIVSAAVGIIQFAFLAIFLQQGNSFPSLENYGGNVMAFLVSGALFTGFMSSALSSFSQLITSEQRTGTLEAVLTTPFSIGRVIAYAAVSSFIQLAVSTFLMIVLFGFVFSIPFNINLWQLILVMVIGYFPLVGLGLAGGGVLLVTKRGDPVTWLLTTFTTLFSGVLYPVEILPQWLQNISWYVPTTRVLSALRGALTGYSTMFTLDTIYLLISSVVSMVLGLLVFRWGLNRAIWDGSTTSY